MRPNLTSIFALTLAAMTAGPSFAKDAPASDPDSKFVAIYSAEWKWRQQQQGEQPVDAGGLQGGGPQAAQDGRVPGPGLQEGGEDSPGAQHGQQQGGQAQLLDEAVEVADGPGQGRGGLLMALEPQPDG